MITALKKGDMVAKPGCFRLRWMGGMWLTQYILQLENPAGWWYGAEHNYIMSLDELNDSGFELVGNDLPQMEMF